MYATGAVWLTKRRFVFSTLSWPVRDTARTVPVAEWGGILVAHD